MGYVAVAVLVGSGLINSWFLVDSFSRITEDPYGRLLLVKLCLFAGMLALAISNRVWHVPSLIKAGEVGPPSAWLVRLRRHVVGEQVLGFLILLVVSILGTMHPPMRLS